MKHTDMDGLQVESGSRNTVQYRYTVSTTLGQTFKDSD